jgi:FkbM family methyltransferase
MNNILNLIQKYNLTSFLDIGANVGDVSAHVRAVFPNIKIFCIEANPACEHDLTAKNLSYRIECLSDVISQKNFYVSTIGDGKNTGASLYKELTPYYSDEKYKTLDLITNTLDNIFPSEIFDFIKMDTQGSELDIMKGGKNLCARAKFIKIEVAVLPYNLGAPFKDDVFSYLKSINYAPLLKDEEHKYEDGRIFQEDYIFYNMERNDI